MSKKLSRLALPSALGLVLVFCGNANAQMLKHLVDCEELANFILRKHSSVNKSVTTNGGKVLKSQLVEVREILEEACKPPFEACGFTFCSRKSAGENRDGPKMLREENKETKTSKGSASLSWIADEMSCDDFLTQLRSRFQRPQNKPTLSQDKKAELDLALEIACSPRFKHCDFDACK